MFLHQVLGILGDISMQFGVHPARLQHLLRLRLRLLVRAHMWATIVVMIRSEKTQILCTTALELAQFLQLRLHVLSLVWRMSRAMMTIVRHLALAVPWTPGKRFLPSVILELIIFIQCGLCNNVYERYYCGNDKVQGDPSVLYLCRSSKPQVNYLFFVFRDGFIIASLIFS